MTHVLLLRHGRTAFNASGRLQGQIDIPLDEVGRWQAATAAAALFAAHSPTAIFASDLGRAAQTAGFLADLADLPVILDERLRERSFGDWEGLTGEEIRSRFPDEHVRWNAGHDVERPGAERRSAVGARMAEAIREHTEAVGVGGTLVIVSHGASITLGITLLLELDVSTWRGFRGLDNAHWSHVQPSRDGLPPAWRVVGHNLGPSISTASWNAGRRS